jgi:hypothetical protein
MYEDDKLFAKALSLLERTYAQRRRLLTALGDIVLIEDEEVAVFGNAGEMSASVAFLTFLVRSAEVWGVFSRVSGPFGPDKFKLVLETCDKLQRFLTLEAAQEVYISTQHDIFTSAHLKLVIFSIFLIFFWNLISLYTCNMKKIK